MAERDTTTNRLRDLRRGPDAPAADLPDWLIEQLIDEPRRREEEAARRRRPALELPVPARAAPDRDPPAPTVLVFDISSGVPI